MEIPIFEDTSDDHARLGAQLTNGRLTIEAFGREIATLAAAPRVWRDVFPNSEEVYRFGFKHVKQGWANAGR